MNDMFPAISVALITRNRFSVLCECIQSLLQQSLLPYEIMVIDSESEDETKDITRIFPRLSYIRVPHRGVAYARNRAIDVAKGEYIAFIDDDCVADSNWLKKLYQGLVSQNGDMAAGNTYFFDSPSKLQYGLNRISPYGECIAPQDKIWWNPKASAKFKYTVFCTINLFIKKEVFKKIRFDDYYRFWFEDTDFCIRAQRMGFKAILVTEARVFHKNDTRGRNRDESNRFLFRNTAYFVAKNFKVNLGYLFHLAFSFLKVIRFSYHKQYRKNITLFLLSTYEGIKDGKKARLDYTGTRYSPWEISLFKRGI